MQDAKSFAAKEEFDRTYGNITCGKILFNEGELR
jgi:hypothetical protein